MATEILNGVRNYYGPQSVEDKVPGEIKTVGSTRELVLDFAYDDLPTYSANGSRDLLIPNDSLIVSSRLHVITAGASGTSYTIGLYTAAGVAIDADGLHTAAQLPVASLTEDAWFVGGGALVGATVGATSGQIVVTASGTFDAGVYRLIVEYIEDKD